MSYSASKFSVAILGGIGAGKKILAQKLSRQLTPYQKQKIDIGSVGKPSNFKIFIDRPFDQLLEKYVLSLSLQDLIDKQMLQRKMEEFRSYHRENVFPAKFTADFWIQDLEDEERIHHLTLEILKKWRASLSSEDEESPEVQVYLDRRIQKAHPGKTPGNLYIL